MGSDTNPYGYRCVVVTREGSDALSGTLPEGEVISGGLYIAMPASAMMCE